MRIAHKLVFAAGLLPCAAHADVDWFAVPSLSVVQVYDDNLFYSPVQKEDDRVLQSTPALKAGAQSPRLNVQGRYSFDAEQYDEHTELDADQAREHAGMEFRYQADRQTTLTMDGTYLKTNRPGELNPDVGVQSGRASAEALSLRPGISERFAYSVASAGYAYTQERVVAGPGTDTHTATLDLTHDLSRRDNASLGYSYRRFIFEGQGEVDAHTFTAGYTREFTPTTSGTLKGGPRFSEGSVDPEVSVSVRNLLDPGEVMASYSRGLSTAIGQAGAVTTEVLETTCHRPIGRDWDVRVAASWLFSEREDSRARVRRMGVEASYRVVQLLWLTGSYQSTAQHGSLEAQGQADIFRNVVMVGVLLTGPEPHIEKKDSEGQPQTPTDEEPGEGP